jgi:two-component system, OmpR family, sensor histidine kinase QseC
MRWARSTGLRRRLDRHLHGAPSMSIERRLLWLLLICAPLVWALGLGISVTRAQHEVNELFDTEMIRLSRQVQATLVLDPTQGPPRDNAAAPPTTDMGAGDVRDLAIAVWDRGGHLKLADREGVMLPHEADAAGFRNLVLADQPWRVYYLQSLDGRWLVAAGQKVEEREELVLDLTLGQLLPWLLVLPVLLAVMVWAVRRALAPVRQLARDLGERSADALHPVPDTLVPAELRPMFTAMNGLFARIESALARERQFTADAAHELRTPLAVLRAQWDVVRRAATPAERTNAEAKLGAGLDRLDRLVTQMLALARIDRSSLPQPLVVVDWAALVEAALSDCLPLAGRRSIEFACDGLDDAATVLPLQGEAALLAVMLRNLLDNATRYAPAGSTVQLRLGPEGIEIENPGPALAPEVQQRLGERFYRPDGQDEAGSGLGLSIVRRIAALHGLVVTHGPLADGQGVRATVRRAAQASDSAAES